MASKKKAAEVFDRAGHLLFGSEYVAPLAKMLDVDKRTVMSWRKAKSRIPAGIWPQLHVEIGVREKALADFGATLLAAMPASTDES